MSEDNIAVVRSLFDAFNRGDLDRAAALVSDDFELIDVPSGETFHGPDGCRRWLGTFRAALPDATTEIVTAFGEGNLVATEHIGRGTHTGPFATPAGAIPPTGRQIELRIGEIYELAGGKITRLSAYYDSSTIMRQLGLLPPQGGTGERAMTALMGFGVKARHALRRSDPA
jgi:steroid delta-isomerase-like uncharacterized protein